MRTEIYNQNISFTNIILPKKVIASVALVAGLLFLSACSTGYGSVYPQGRSLPTIPEISRPEPRRAAPPKKAVRKVYTPKVKKYSVDKPAEPVITQKDVAVVLGTEQNSGLSNEERIKIAQKKATVVFDPYAVIPDSRSSSTTKASPAVTSLMLQAKGELAIGNTQSAISKLERGLRIESKNAKLWNLLAQANYDQSSYQQAISMAKKSIRYSSNDDLVSKNWKLIQKAGKSSGDTVVVKEALNYFKVNP